MSEELSAEEQEQAQRYQRAAHAMQSGVAMDLNHDPSSGTSKHLRVGVNAAMADQGGLVTLLIEKGVFTKLEYLTAIANHMEAEAVKYEQILTARVGKEIHLL